MPTKKRRVGFIPRTDVLAIIDKLSNESNLSYSKIINILVEEALFKRRMFKKGTGVLFNEFKDNGVNTFKEKKEVINKEFKNKFKNKLQKDEHQNFKEVKEESLDDEIYAKFIMFLQFQERMKKREELQ